MAQGLQKPINTDRFTPEVPMLLACVRFLVFLGIGMSLSACLLAPGARDALPSTATAETVALASLKEDLDAGASGGALPVMAVPLVKEMPQIRGLGMAQISKQPGASLNEKRLLAIRAARLEALRDLTEQVHGIAVTSETTLRDTVIRSDSLRGLVEGEIRGARTERITPKGSDSYEVLLSLDPDVVAYIARAARLGV